jgi:hypothetical protein
MTSLLTWTCGSVPVVLDKISPYVVENATVNDESLPVWKKRDSGTKYRINMMSPSLSPKVSSDTHTLDVPTTSTT